MVWRWGTHTNKLLSCWITYTQRSLDSSFRPEPELWIQKRVLIDNPVLHVTSVSWCSLMFWNTWRIGDSNECGDLSDDDIDWKEPLSASPRSCASSRTTKSLVSSLIVGWHPLFRREPFASSYTSRTNFEICGSSWSTRSKSFRVRRLNMSLYSTWGHTCSRVHLALVKVSLLPGTFKQNLKMRMWEKKSKSVTFLA